MFGTHTHFTMSPVPCSRVIFNPKCQFGARPPINYLYVLKCGWIPVIQKVVCACFSVGMMMKMPTAKSQTDTLRTMTWWKVPPDDTSERLYHQVEDWSSLLQELNHTLGRTFKNINKTENKYIFYNVFETFKRHSAVALWPELLLQQSNAGTRFGWNGGLCVQRNEWCNLLVGIWSLPYYNVTDMSSSYDNLYYKSFPKKRTDKA